ncbi:MAG: rhodanese-like domain-containing protein [Pseudohongiellaceae bacterium]
MLGEPISLLVSASLFGLFGVSWEAIDARIENEFPQVPFISQEDLASRLAGSQPGGVKNDIPALVDVRAADEFRVSHLPGAENLITAAAIAAAYPDRDAPVVVYCSVGYRSAAVAAELASLGYDQVFNLRHSIFAWANADRPLVNAAGPTDKAHPYNFVWGRLLDASRRQYQP